MNAWGDSMALVGLLLAACSEPPPQTVLRFSSASSLDVPSGSRLRVSFYPQDRRQHESADEVGDFAFREDLKVVVDARDGDRSRRFTVFVELLGPSGVRISWARIRTGFGPERIGQVHIEFAPNCPAPGDRLEQPPDFAPEAACGSHDTCTRGANQEGACAPSCYEPTPFDPESLGPQTVSRQCAASDCLAVESLEAGWDATCARYRGELFCWGQVANGATGEQRTARPTRPVDPSGIARFDPSDEYRGVSLAIWQVCVVQASGALRCGGSNNFNVLGTDVPQASPCCVVRPNEIVFSKVVARGVYTCGLERDTGAIWCTGNHPIFRAVNSEEEAAEFERIVPEQGFTDLVAARNTVCGVRDDAFSCFGQDLFTNSVPALSQVLDVSTVGLSGCIVSSDGELSCWGAGTNGVDFQEQPTSFGDGWSMVALPGRLLSDPNHWCGIRTDGSLWCWGDNLPDGLLGADPATVSRVPDDSPVRVGNDVGWSAVAVGRFHSCGVRDGRTFCWGSNERRQLGVDGPGGPAPVEVCVPSW